MLALFSRYISVGVVNTLIHWVVFFLLYVGLCFSQAISNVLAFSLAVTFSFFANAIFTFKAEATGKRYCLFVIFMGSVSFLTGALADALDIYPLITLLAFSAISLFLGFVYSHWIVFRRRA